jgi:hypothetical protein
MKEYILTPIMTPATLNRSTSADKSVVAPPTVPPRQPLPTATIDPTKTAGVALATARAKGDAEPQRIAVAELEKALVHWKRLAEATEKFNQLPVDSNWRSPFSWTLLIPDVENDIELAKAPLATKN